MSNKQSNIYPNFFHIGIPRTGTKTIQTILSSDPRIRFSSDRYFQTPDWYFQKSPFNCNSEFINVHSDERMVRQDGNNFKMIVTLERISRAVPDATIILTIREQRSWLLSRYKYGIGKGYLSASFEDWLLSCQGIDFLSIGNFATLYHAIRSFFPEENIKVLLFEELKNNYEAFFKKLYQILGLPLQKLDVIKENVSLPDKILGKKRILNKFAYMPSKLSKLQEILYKKATAFLIQYTLNSEDIEVKTIVWNDTPLLKAIQDDFRFSNNKFKKLSGIKLEEYGYLL